MDSRAWLSAAALVTLASVAASVGGCEAELTNDCTAGPCEGATVAVASTAAGASCVFPDTGELPCDVYTVLDGNCHRCHQDPQLGGAPFPLLTWENFQVIYGAKPIWQRADVAIEPGAIPQMPYLSDPIPVDQRAILHAWFDTCEAGACAKADPVDGSGGAGTTASTSTGTGGGSGGGGGG